MTKRNLTLTLIISILGLITYCWLGFPRLTLYNFGVPVLILLFFWLISEFFLNLKGKLPAEKERKVLCIWYLALFIIFAFYLLIFSGKINSSPKAASNSSQKIVATSAYDNAIKRMTAVSHKTVLQLVSRDKFTLLYMGRKSCPHCQQFMTVFEPSLKKTKKQVYYLNSEKMSDSLYRFADKYKIEEIPQLMAFRKGHLIETFEGKPDEKSILAFLDNYSDSE